MKSLLQKGIAVAGIAGLGLNAEGCDQTAPIETTAAVATAGDISQCGEEYQLSSDQIRQLTAEDCANVISFAEQDSLLRGLDGKYTTVFPIPSSVQMQIDCPLNALVDACEETQ